MGRWVVGATITAFISVPTTSARSYFLPSPSPRPPILSALVYLLASLTLSFWRLKPKE